MFWLIIIYIIHFYFFIEFLDYYYDLVLLFLYIACYPIVHIVAILFSYLLKQHREAKLLLILALIVISTFFGVGLMVELSWISKDTMIKLQPLASSAISIIYLSVIFVSRAIEYSKERKRRHE